MDGKIFLLSGNETLQALVEQGYASEDLLQQLLERYPELLAGDQMNRDDPRRWLLIGREFGVPDDVDAASRWSLDHLFLDQDATLTLIEVKRSSDTRIRREVVGQMLDYAANAVRYCPTEKIKAKFEALCNARNEDAGAKILEFLRASSDDTERVTSFWNQVKTNLQAGKIRMIFVADVIPLELKRIIEFLNEQMDPAEVIGVEIRQFVGEGLQTLVPQVIGVTAEAQSKRISGERRIWDETSFFEDAKSHLGAKQIDSLRELYQFCLAQGATIGWGTGKRASFSPRFPKVHATIGPITLYADGELQLKVSWLKTNAGAMPRAERLGQAMHRIFPLRIDENFMKGELKIPCSEWEVQLKDLKHAIAETVGPDS
jgi:hypothetical protein